jgi:hypothetical protein
MISFVGQGPAFINTTGVNISASEPSGAKEGDLLLLINSTDDYAGTATPDPGPVGWTLIGHAAHGAGLSYSARVTLHYLIRRATSPTIVWSTGRNRNFGAIAAFRGVNTFNPIDSDVVSVAVAGNTWGHTGPVTTLNECMIVAGIGVGDDAFTVSNPMAPGLSGPTVLELVDTSAGSDGGAAMFYGAQETAGPSGALSITGPGKWNASVIFALVPSGSGSRRLFRQTWA